MSLAQPLHFYSLYPKVGGNATFHFRVRRPTDNCAVSVLSLWLYNISSPFFQFSSLITAPRAFLSFFCDEIDVFEVVIVVVIGRLLASAANESESGQPK